MSCILLSELYRTWINDFIEISLTFATLGIDFSIIIHVDYNPWKFWIWLVLIVRDRLYPKLLGSSFYVKNLKWSKWSCFLNDSNIVQNMIFICNFWTRFSIKAKSRFVELKLRPARKVRQVEIFQILFHANLCSKYNGFQSEKVIEIEFKYFPRKSAIFNIVKNN